MSKQTPDIRAGSSELPADPAFAVLVTTLVANRPGGGAAVLAWFDAAIGGGGDGSRT